MHCDDQTLYRRDLEHTLANRERLKRNGNLMSWYQQLYEQLFRPIPDFAAKRVLEIGSGASPLKHLFPNVITTDVLKMGHVDHVFDCHEIAAVREIPDHSIDLITLTNVLHHLRDPLAFLRAATTKLVPGGRLFLVEPYFSWLSYPMYKMLHHEPTDFSVDRPVLTHIEGPLSTSNQAIPHMIFFLRPQWLNELQQHYALKSTRIDFYTSVAYMLTGGISRTFPVPTGLYRRYLAFDRWLARTFPRLFASFFSVQLVAKG